MKIESLQLKNFRCFEDVTVYCHKKLTVFVGVNGCGKTSILDGFSLFLKCIADKLLSYKQGFPSVYIDKNDANNRSADKNINLELKFDTYEMLKFTFIHTETIKGKLELEDIIPATSSFFERLYDDIDKNEIKILAYYSSKRIFSPESSASHSRSGFASAFENAFNSTIDFKASLTWFDAKDAEEARKRSNTGEMEYRNPELTAVREAISQSLSEDGKIYSYPHMDGVPPELYINHNTTGKSLKVTQLSDGYKTMLALIMDLARRMATANTEKYSKSGKSILESPAIVLIDEVELHLHPSWQQRVLPDFMRIFPNTQFIVTTHSPQVVSSVEPQHVRILKDGKVLPVETSTFGAESSRVLEEVFGVSVRPQNDAIRALDEYLKLISDGKGHSAEAKALRAQLDNWLADDPILDRADMFITRSDRQKAREEKVRA